MFSINVFSVSKILFTQFTIKLYDFEIYFDGAISIKLFIIFDVLSRLQKNHCPSKSWNNWYLNQKPTNIVVVIRTIEKKDAKTGKQKWLWNGKECVPSLDDFWGIWFECRIFKILTFLRHFFLVWLTSIFI